MRLRHFFLATALAVLAAAPPAAGAREVVLHEPIPPDARDDIALGVVVEGDIPAALDTPSGLVRAPDPRRPPAPSDHTYTTRGDPGTTFKADRDTRRPEVLAYDDPFDPSVAPFKRLVAFDAVNDRFELALHDAALSPIRFEEPQSGDDRFYGDIVVDIGPDRHVRIPSVGPGTRVVHARASNGAREVPFRLLRDGADNWFVDGLLQTGQKARLVLELAIPRRAFGGDFADTPWESMPIPPRVPPNVAEVAARVNAHIGVSRALRPKQALEKLVAYYRSFVDSEAPLRSQSNVYEDLAMAQKGVCRHRSFAFMISALALGIPTRMVMNEAHAWVEVHDGTLWRRIDLGGAGRALSEGRHAQVAYNPPTDPFSWPPGATRGQDLGEARPNAPSSAAGDSGSGGGGGRPGSSSGGSKADSPAIGTTQAPVAPTAGDARPAPQITLRIAAAKILRGKTLSVEGDVVADGDGCPWVSVEIALRDGSGARAREVRLGALATDGKGHYAGSLVVPPTLPLGDYELRARTLGDSRCGRGEGP
jgi:hypothetical protein